ncbi:hypothetical protein [Planococcus sp. YIM B11945]|uniref:hypothetical protein n=1 Tax=Planococcus sp. YIM B11945 TaxID=3435410 RepID=UPI003D7E759C
MGLVVQSKATLNIPLFAAIMLDLEEKALNACKVQSLQNLIRKCQARGAQLAMMKEKGGHPRGFDSKFEQSIGVH